MRTLMRTAGLLMDPDEDCRSTRNSLSRDVCELALDTNTVNRFLTLSDNNRKVMLVKQIQAYPDHPDRFDYWPQLICRTGLTGRCYWEVEWRGWVYISVSYRRVRRRGDRDDCVWIKNAVSRWSLPVDVTEEKHRESLTRDDTPSHGGHFLSMLQIRSTESR
ncbi:neoverrucotoxin subunit alpha-like [Epinephelus moara]|uniref:neoverrucotoxin subunit alpha-like n=1 Tax=Epinephelus moara TaxID=300413 RepID=UPI00214E8036|nr:neoverrucotoxin subunit alpha-like [Epinephelus moara]